jgi:hypothetical protein
LRETVASSQTFEVDVCPQKLREGDGRHVAILEELDELETLTFRHPRRHLVGDVGRKNLEKKIIDVFRRRFSFNVLFCYLILLIYCILFRIMICHGNISKLTPDTGSSFKVLEIDLKIELSNHITTLSI